MKALDRYLQRKRIAKVRPFITAGARVLDIGCGDGALFTQLSGLIGWGVGVDSELPAPRETERYRLLPGWFPAALPDEDSFDAITLLAVLEHIPAAQVGTFAEDCARRLKPGGQLLITVPSPQVDSILDALRFLRLIDGMSLDQHYRFDHRQTPTIFEKAGLTLKHASTFQCGLNNLFVFEKTSKPK